MTTNKFSLPTLGVVLLSLLAATAREFPDAWFWDSKAEHRDNHVALEGKPMPSLAGLSEWLNGTVTSADIKGKVVVVDFYATWCGPCMAAIPKNHKLLADYKTKGLVLFGVCTSSRGQDKYASNAKQHDITYPIARDAQQEVAKRWAVHYYPTYAVIDRKGVVRAIGLKPGNVEAVVKKLLDEPAS